MGKGILQGLFTLIAGWDTVFVNPVMEKNCKLRRTIYNIKYIIFEKKKKEKLPL